MSLACFFGRHRPSLVSIRYGRDGGHRAHCERCAIPLERAEAGTWQVVTPLAQRIQISAREDPS